MILKRKVLAPVSSGSICVLKEEFRLKLLESDDYLANGNVIYSYHNRAGRIHMADADLFICSTGTPFNSKELVEIIPIRFPSDRGRNHSYNKSVSRRTRYIVDRRDVDTYSDHADLGRCKSILNRRIMELNVKFGINDRLWKSIWGIK